MVLDQNDHPALFLEMGYPEKSNLLFIDAARDIAAEMNLPLYYRVNSKNNKVVVTDDKVKLLAGRAPVEYFDLIGSKMTRGTVTFSAVKRDVRYPSQARH